MSYSAKTKLEIINKNKSKEEQIALLSAIIRNNSHLVEEISVITENIDYAKYVISLFKSTFNIDVHFGIRKNYNFSRNDLYILKITNNTIKILHQLGIIDVNMKTKVSPKTYILDDEKLVRNYLTGVFLAAGSVNDPISNYHLELVLSDEKYASFIQQLLKRFNIDSTILKRRKIYMLYIKQADTISDFLKLMEANNSVIYFEEIKVQKEQTNINNRINNCEQANVEKSLLAAINQINDIIYLKKHNLFDLLDDKAKIICKYRLKYDDASLSELVDHIHKNEGMHFTKSGINHKFRKVRSLKSKYSGLDSRS
ncbi:MAG: DNA-binding protein WhiA [Bacilli bacterium]